MDPDRPNRNVAVPRLARVRLLAAAAALGIAAQAAADTEPVLRVATRLSPVAHLPYPDFPLTLEDALVRRFARSLGMRVRFLVAADVGGALAMLGERADMAVPGTVPSKDLRATALPGPAHLEIHPRAVYCAGRKRPTTLRGLNPGPLRVATGTWHADLAREAGLEPDLPSESTDVPARLRDLARARDGYALGDQLELLLLQRVLPCLRPVLGFEENGALRWWFPDTAAGRTLSDKARRFFADLRLTGELDQILAEHLDHVHEFGPGAATFMQRVRERLARYLPLFREGARRFRLDWHLLAAVAYQESHWDPAAVSPTGVRGLMMLTQDTAQQMDLDDRAHPGKSLNAGAAYLLRVKGKIPRRIREPDRTWMALAAYNVGFGHLEDARILAQDAGRSPDRWLDVRPFLFRLDDPGCERLKRGCYKGGEGAIYVRRIRNYLEALVWLDASGWLWEIPSLAKLRPAGEAGPRG